MLTRVEPGMIVQLASGGPRMTVVYESDGGCSAVALPVGVVCNWFVDGELKEACFSRNVLKEVVQINYPIDMRKPESWQKSIIDG